MTFVDSKRGWAVGTVVGQGDTGIVLKTSDGGRTWTPHYVKVASGLLAVSFCDANVGWALGPTQVFTTQDGGSTWREVWRLQGGGSLFSVACEDGGHAWAVGPRGRVIKFADHGGSSLALDTGLQTELYRVRLFDGRVWAVGSGGAALVSEGERGHFRVLPTGSRAALFDVWMAGTKGWLVGADGTIVRTTDGGATWSPAPSPTSRDLSSLFFLRPELGWASGGAMTVLKWQE
jgi:photosystem II stability/assembly factor-like uncharacterized protein